MTENEGRGFILRAAPDGPWAGWAGSRFLEEGLASVHAAPGRALARLMNLAALLPGGFGLVWDHPPAWMEALPAESRQGWWEAISAIPGLVLHVGPETGAQQPGGAFRAWLHAPEMPEGPLGEAWRQGVVGWVPRTGIAWHLPDLGTPAPGDEVPPGWLWGEVTLPFGVREANPLVRVLVAGAGSALGGLVLAKLIALILAWHCWRGGRQRLLRRINVFYAVLVTWNLVALLARAWDVAA